MKSSKIFIILFLLSILVVSCSLDRSNPLDPDAHDITAPLKVTGLTIPEFSNQSVNLTWDAQIGIPKYYISSADLMSRNLDHRVEVVCPINSLEHQKEIQDLIDIQLKDNVKARNLQGNNIDFLGVE